MGLWWSAWAEVRHEALMCKPSTQFFRFSDFYNPLSALFSLFPFPGYLWGGKKGMGGSGSCSSRLSFVGEEIVNGWCFPPEVTPAGCNLCVPLLPTLQPCQGWLQLLRMWGEHCLCSAWSCWGCRKRAKQPPCPGLGAAARGSVSILQAPPSCIPWAVCLATKIPRISEKYLREELKKKSTQK